MRILAVETSCDETSAAICEDGVITSNIIVTQHAHQIYGGVIPELASRIHTQHIVSVVDAALKKSNCILSNIDVFAFTQMPGLVGSLLVGACFTKSLALVHQKPLIGVNHIHAHVSANFIPQQKPAFPFLCLTVSGGHTQIFICTNFNTFKSIGTTIDDAAGEAFDKSAKILGLSYPGGVLIDQLAQKGRPIFTFAKPNMPQYNYSFSGLKTSILYFIQKQMQINEHFIQDNLHDLCASIQTSIVTILLDKLFLAAKENNITNLCLAGGVAANSLLRKNFEIMCIQKNYSYFIPPFEYCTDNAGMIAMNAYYQALDNNFVSLDTTPSAHCV